MDPRFRSFMLWKTLSPLAIFAFSFWIADPELFLNNIRLRWVWTTLNWFSLNFSSCQQETKKPYLQQNVLTSGPKEWWDCVTNDLASSTLAIKHTCNLNSTRIIWFIRAVRRTKIPDPWILLAVSHFFSYNHERGERIATHFPTPQLSSLSVKGKLKRYGNTNVIFSNIKNISPTFMFRWLSLDSHVVRSIFA